MAYIWQRWIAAELREVIALLGETHSVKVVEVADWKNRGRPASTGEFDPDDGKTNHHTGTTTSSSSTHPTLATLIQGRSDLPGPLCHVSVGWDGTIYVVAAGRANHAGRTDKTFRNVPAGSDGNAHFLGDEVDTNGTQKLPSAQRHSVAIVNATFARHYKQGSETTHRHQDLT